MDPIQMRRTVLEYAVRHNCYNTFDALYTREDKSNLTQIVLALFAIRRAVHDYDLDKFSLSINILHRIYKSVKDQLPNLFKVYLKLIKSMEMTLLSHAVLKKNQQQMMSVLHKVMSREHVTFDNQTEKDQNEVQHCMWELYKLIVGILASQHTSCMSGFSSASAKSDYSRILMDKFSAKVMGLLQPCQLEIIMQKVAENSTIEAETKVGQDVLNFLKGKQKLTDDDLLGLLEILHVQDKNNNSYKDSGIEDNTATEDVSMENTPQASSLLDKESPVTVDDNCSVVSPSVSEDRSSINLDDLEQMDLEFTDNSVPSTPDISAFFQGTVASVSMS